MIQKVKNSKKREKPILDIPDKRTRIKAFITDSFMLVTPLMYIVFYLIMGGREGFAANKLLGWIYIIVPLIFIQIVFISKASQTPGMRAYNIKVVDSRRFDMPTFGQIVARQVMIVPSLFFFGWITMFFRKDHRMLHELISHTTMINTDDLSSPKNKI